MPPGREMTWVVGVGHRLFADDSDVPRSYVVTITGRGPVGDLPPVTYRLDLDELREIHAPRLGSLEGIAQEIKQLRKSVDSARQSFGRDSNADYQPDGDDED
jgi:hypothetical protein